MFDFVTVSNDCDWIHWLSLSRLSMNKWLWPTNRNQLTVTELTWLTATKTDFTDCDRLNNCDVLWDWLWLVWQYYMWQMSVNELLWLILSDSWTDLALFIHWQWVRKSRLVILSPLWLYFTRPDLKYHDSWHKLWTDTNRWNCLDWLWKSNLFLAEIYELSNIDLCGQNKKSDKLLSNFKQQSHSVTFKPKLPESDWSHLNGDYFL